MKALKLCLLAVAVMLIASGCLTSPNAFYTEADVFQDDRIIGDYTVEKAEEGSSVRKDPDHAGRYVFQYFEQGRKRRWIEFTGTLFKVGTNTFVDLLPWNDSFTDHVPGAPPAGLDIIRNITRQPVHAVVRIAITDKGVAFSLPEKRAVANLVQRNPAFTNYVRDDAILLLPQSSKELRALLEKEGDALFPKPTDFKKPKPLPH